MRVNKAIFTELQDLLYSHTVFGFLFNISRNPARLFLTTRNLSLLTHVTLGPLYIHTAGMCTEKPSTTHEMTLTYASDSWPAASTSYAQDALTSSSSVCSSRLTTASTTTVDFDASGHILSFFVRSSDLRLGWWAVTQKFKSLRLARVVRSSLVLLRRMYEAGAMVEVRRRIGSFLRGLALMNSTFFEGLASSATSQIVH